MARLSPYPKFGIRNPKSTRRVCFVTGTRAEFGLMRSTLDAIRSHPGLMLQIIATGMHLDPSRGQSLDAIRAGGWTVDRVVPWEPASHTPASTARNTGLATAGIVDALESLRSDVVLVVGDRVEAFAAATAGHLSGRVVAHVHGGDRAAGQVDDALRHAITKLSHLHFPATKASADRVLKMGEDAWRIRRVGSPGIDGIAREAARWDEVSDVVGPLDRRRYGVLVWHPVEADDARERARADVLLTALESSRLSQIVVVYPNNDPGSAGIAAYWDRRGTRQSDTRITFLRDLARPAFLGLMRDAAVLVGNSSSGIIEAASFGTPVIDIGPRQRGRERGQNVLHIAQPGLAVARAVNRILNASRSARSTGKNIYGGDGTGRRIAEALARATIHARLTRKLIAY